ncbi:sodium:solute symporter [Mycobacterium sp. AT1]|uniref:sodium:solute symporter family protein n=1 Tax=Mycobacterium sp. AT1 TaxID=1961706 RepID=UPI0009AEC453|nr:sodium:solute symporter [Mycobacterium sp. AT1]OPX09842.1 sodium:solute symporter [Mycobacterium sp. AT1]
MTTAIIVAGIVVIGVIGFSGRRRRDLSGWTVAERDLPRWTSWFLQAGESLTTFSFLGLAGIAFTGGVSATFAVCYLTASAVGLYFVAPRLRDLGAARGYLTMSDFFHDRYRSRSLSVVMAVVGALFLVPYLALQITGLGLIVGLATGSPSARGLSMVLACVLVVVFVAWAGIHGIARVAVFKDFGMLLALVLVAVFVVSAAGGFPEVFTKVAQVSDQLLTTHAPGYDATFFITAVVVTTIGSSFNVFPHLWPPVFAAKSGQILRSNFKWLGVYQLLLLLPITVGMAAVLLIDPDTKSNSVLFTVSQQTMPEWLVAVVAVCGSAAAMVPAAAITMGISSLLANNVCFAASDRTRFRLNKLFVVVAVGAALWFSVSGADIGALLLLTYGGLTQLAPTIAAALPHRVRLSAPAAMSGTVVGTLVVVVLTFADIPIGSWDSGLIGLGPNLVVLAIVELLVRAGRRGAGSPAARSALAPDPV